MLEQAKVAARLPSQDLERGREGRLVPRQRREPPGHRAADPPARGAVSPLELAPPDRHNDRGVQTAGPEGELQLQRVSPSGDRERQPPGLAIDSEAPLQLL